VELFPRGVGLARLLLLRPHGGLLFEEAGPDNTPRTRRVMSVT
jgi:hypothetical protein